MTTNNAKIYVPIYNVTDIMGQLKANSDYIDRICDYGGSSYICDAISEIADGATSIYYSDILDFIKHNPKALADVVAEGLYIVDSSHEYDLYKHGQAAEYMTIERDLYDNIDDMIKLYAIDYYRANHGDEIDAETWEMICDDLEEIANNNRLWDIENIVDKWTDDAEDMD